MLFRSPDNATDQRYEECCIMCDYSLEMYRSKPAVVGERYETTRFPSGSVGFISPGDADTAVCMAYDTRLELKNIRRDVQLGLGIPETAEATFARIEGGPHHDGVRFNNGREITLQQLGPGVSASVIDALTRPVVPAPAPKFERALEPVARD
jgi:hypothetical protein